MPVQIDSRLHCKMCQCTVYAILTVRLLHYHHIGTCTYLLVNRHEIQNGRVSRQGWWFCEIPVHSLTTVLIHNSGHFGPPWPFWAPRHCRGCQWLVMPLANKYILSRRVKQSLLPQIVCAASWIQSGSFSCCNICFYYLFLMLKWWAASVDPSLQTWSGHIGCLVTVRAPTQSNWGS